MNRYEITVRGKSYPILVGAGLQKELTATVAGLKPAKVAIITDARVKKLWGKDVLASIKSTGIPAEIFSFPDGEQNKNQKTVTKLQHALLKKRYGRDTLIVALGGGVVGDLAGFVAATYLRGIPFIQVPTTTLATVDSSIGGKVGIDTKYGKNTVGAFHQPKAVIIDLRFIASQDKEHVLNGLLEAIKVFFTSEKESLALVDKLDMAEPLKDAALFEDIVMRSIRLKGGFVSRDETEQGERMIVNFGHTIGHAVELLSEFKLPHGFCVGYGMIIEARIAELQGILSTADRSYLESYLAKFGITAEPLKQFSIEKIIETTRSDKKVKAGMPQYVLIDKIGSVYIKDGAYAHPVPDAIVEKALNSI